MSQDIILEKEKFDSIKELSKIQMAVSDGHTALKELNETKEKFLQTREEEAKDRIVKILKESREALENISTNHDKLTHFREELETYVNEIKSSSNMIMAFFQDFNDEIDEVQKDMDEHIKKINDIKNKNKIILSEVESERKNIAISRKLLKDETRLLNDRRETLERGFKELKRLKDKKE